MTWFMFRHPGAIAWIEQQSIRVDRWEHHLDPAEVASSDRVYGTLTINLAEQLVRRGASVREFIVGSPK